MIVEKDREFMTIRELAATGYMSERYLRELVKRGKCPGIYAGKRFLINVELLKHQLNEESKIN
jgi:hypothetical protein